MEVKTNTEIFLKELHVENVSEKNDYILHEEFKKTPKNTNWKVVIILSIMVFSLAAASFGISKWIATRNIISDYNLDEFQDVDLMGVLSQVNKIEKKKEDAERELLLLRRDYKNKVLKLEGSFNQEKTLLESRGYDAETLQEKLLEIESRRVNALKQLDEEYNKEILLKEEQVTLFKDQIKELDSDKIQQAQEYENILANEEKKFKLEKEQLIERYENQIKQKDNEYTKQIDELLLFQAELQQTLKDTGLSEMLALKELYNPTIDEENTSLLNTISSSPDKNSLTREILSNNEQILTENIMTVDELLSYRKELKEWDKLVNFIEGVPFENDIPVVLKQLDSRYYSLLNKLSNYSINKHDEKKQLLSDFEIETEESKKVLIEYEYFHKLINGSFFQLIESLGGGDGFILKDTEQDIFLAYMNPYMEIEQNSVAQVYNFNNQYIGDVKLWKEGLIYKVLAKDDNILLEDLQKVFVTRGNN